MTQISPAVFQPSGLVKLYINGTIASSLPINHRIVVVDSYHIMTISYVTALLNWTKYICLLIAPLSAQLVVLYFYN